ncbi:cytochrome P450 [Nocardioides litoris]|uniref:cytochrome P450 n=1 Tax=Nocardioides litoris TaxID=1926648 RepID=UPI001FE3EB25|nr:cytochrome P450 [Nocardioides litoris]
MTSTLPDGQTVLPEGFDLTDPFLIEERIPHDELAALRRAAPVHWVPQAPGTYDGMAAESGAGYWAVTRHEDVLAISKNSRDWSTEVNGAIIRFSEGMTREQVELQRTILINQDPPHHTAHRAIISRGFTPRAIHALEEVMQLRARTIVAEAVAKGEGDFVGDIAAELPLQAIAELIGIPQEDRLRIFDWSNQMLASDDPEIVGTPEIAAAEILGYAMELAADRKANPRDDIVTKLVNADRDGRGLTDDEFGFFVILLAVAGNETTRNAITHGMDAFFDNPDQWDLWVRERPAEMVDEVVRWATPVTVFQRTALRDVEVGGVTVRQGQRVALFYASANHDDAVFTEPFRFDVTRSPNPQVGFGGNGAHYCVGANLARQEIRLIFTELAEQCPGITKLAPPRRLRHAWVNGIKELRVRYA